MADAHGGLPFVDEHATVLPLAPDRAWVVLEHYVARLLHTAATRPDARVLTRLLGTRPAAGFEVVERVPGQRLALGGRHRFARYRITLALAGDPRGTRLSAATHADFPGVRGRVYRLLVIGSRGHVVATRVLLRGVRRHAARV